ASLHERAIHYGVRASYRARQSSTIAFSTGIDFLGTAADVERHGSLTIPAREGDVTYFGQPPGDDVTAHAWTAHVIDLAPFATAELRWGPCTLSPGMRLDAMLMDVSRGTPRAGETPAVGVTRLDPTLDPRLTVKWEQNRRLTLFIAGGIYHQPPDAE